MTQMDHEDYPGAIRREGRFRVYRDGDMSQQKLGGRGLSARVRHVIAHLDHLVLTVRDIPRSVDFYTQVLGMREVSFGNGRKALCFGTQKINLHEVGKEFEPKAEKPTAGSADLCFIAEMSLPKVVEHLQARGIAVLEGPVARTGAQGAILSVYLRDPDGNLIEISQYI